MIEAHSTSVNFISRTNILKIIRIECQKIKKNLSMPFTTALGSHSSLENLFIKLHTDQNTVGLGECPIATHIIGNTYEQSKSIIEEWTPLLAGQNFENLQQLADVISTKSTQEIPAKACIEMAFWDAENKIKGQSIAQSLNAAPQSLQTSITLVISEPETMLKKAVEFYELGFRVFKVKIGRDLLSEKDLLKKLSQTLPQASLIIDANQGYSSKESLLLLEDIEKNHLPIHLFEQPVSATDWKGWKEVKEHSSIPIAADESLKTIEDAKRLAGENLCDIFNIKLAKMGISESLKVTQLAKKNKMGLMMGMMMESSLGVSAAAQFASGVGGFSAIDLDTPFYLLNGLKECYFMEDDGTLVVSKIKNGLGFEELP